ARRRARRGCRHARGRLRAVPRPGGVHPPHLARPRGDAPRLRAPREVAAGAPQGRRGARAARAAAAVGAMSGGGQARPAAATGAESAWAQLDYDLPPELIAQHPAERREASRLLVIDRASGTLTDAGFADIGRWLRPVDALVLNETRVRPARLVLRRP